MTSPDQNYTSWHSGMKVVCQDAEWTRALNTKELEEGRIYTIRWVGPAPDDGIICVRLEEVSRLRKGAADDFYFDLYGEKPFRASRFRPVQTRKTDISCFTAMLSPKPAKAGKVRA